MLLAIFGYRQKLVGFYYTPLPAKDQYPSVMPMCDMAPQKLGSTHDMLNGLGPEVKHCPIKHLCSEGSSWN